MLRPWFFPVDIKKAVEAVTRAVEKAESWELASSSGGKISATRATSVFEFVDDVEVTVSSHKAGVLLNAKSASRIGKGDFGQNRRNILELFSATGVELMDEKPPEGYHGLLYCHHTEWPFDDVAPLFFDPDFLPVISPDWIGITIMDKPDPVKVGAKMTLSVAGKFKWEVTFVEWNPPHAFTDRQTAGPFKEFIHRHSFADAGGGTVVCDRLHYQYKHGPVGAIASRFLTAGRLAALLAQRGELLDKHLSNTR